MTPWYEKKVKDRHGRGIACINVYKQFKVPDEYERYIGVLTDRTIELMSFEHTAAGDWDGPKPLLSTDDVDAAIRAAGGSKEIQRFLIGLMLEYGADRLREMSTNDFVGKMGIGPKRLRALVEVGVRDERPEWKPMPISIDGHFSGKVNGIVVEGPIVGTYRANGRR